MTDFKMNCSNFPCQANSAGWCPKCDQPTQGTAMLAAAPQPPAAQKDDVLEALELDPESYRTEGGAIKAAKLRDTILHPADYLPEGHWLWRYAEPFAYLCPAGCGCTWRDNKDGSMSLFGKNSRSCETCENLPLDQLIPLYLSQPTAAHPTPEQVREIERLRADVEGLLKSVAAEQEAREKAEAKCDQYRKDAERYRWLRDKPEEGERHGIALCFVAPEIDGLGHFLPEETDRRIDAALSGKEADRG